MIWFLFKQEDVPNKISLNYRIEDLKKFKWRNIDHGFILICFNGQKLSD